MNHKQLNNAELINQNLSELMSSTGSVTPPAPDGTGSQETDPVFLASEAAKLVPGDKAKLDTADTPAARDAAIVTAIAGVPVFPAKNRIAGMLVDTTGSTGSALLRAWTAGNFGLTAAPFVEDSDGDTLYCRFDIADYTDPLVFPKVTVEAYGMQDDGERQTFTLAAVPFTVVRLYVDDWHRWYVRVNLPRSIGPQAGLTFTVFAL